MSLCQPAMDKNVMFLKENGNLVSPNETESKLAQLKFLSAVKECCRLDSASIGKLRTRNEPLIECLIFVQGDRNLLQ